MGQNKVLPRERIASSFKQLAVSSNDLNSAGAELCEVISSVEAPLKAIKPHVAAWHEIASGGDGGRYWHRDIGYTKVGNTWGIAIRTVEGHEGADDDNVEVWLFADAPRWMQIESVGQIPDLFDELIKRTQDTAKKLRAKTVEAREYAGALTDAIVEFSGQKK